MILRPYQSDLIDRTRASMQQGHRAPLLVAPCGSGKTVMFSYFAKTVTSKNKRTLILAHRAELIDQISDTLRVFDVRHSFIAAGRPHDSRCHVQVGSVFSVARRLSRVHAPDIIIIDEAHHAKAGTWERIFAAFPEAWRIGVTASPIRLSGESLGDVFDDLIIGPSIQALTSVGFLSPYKLYVPSTINVDALHHRAGDFAQNELAVLADKPTITGEAVKEYRKFANHKRAIVFCVSVQHAKHVAEQFSTEGYRAMSLDGKLDPFTRKKIIDRFRDGSIEILTSCDLVSEGFDLPAIECAIMLRPTESLALWIQQSGRALRVSPGKSHAIILDHAGNTMRHDLPDAPREWSLEGSRKSKGEFVPPVKICPQCFGAQRASPRCEFCGLVFPIEYRTVSQVAGTLTEVDKAQLALKLKWKREQGMAGSFQELVKLAKVRGYKNPTGWAAVIMNARRKKAAANA